MGFDVVTLDGKERAPLARVNNSPGNQTGPKVGQYLVNVTEFEEIALRSLNEDVLRGATLAVVDEVGKMESFSKKFEARVRQIFDEDHAERKVMYVGKRNAILIFYFLQRWWPQCQCVERELP